MAKFRLTLATLNDPDQMRALYYRFGDLITITQDSEAQFKEFKVDIPGFQDDDYVNLIFSFGSANVVTISDIVPDIEQTLLNQKIPIAELKKALFGKYPNKNNEINEFIQTLRYDIFKIDQIRLSQANIEECLIQKTALQSYYDRFSVFVNETPSDRVWVKPISGVKYKVISKISDQIQLVDTYRIDYSALLNTETI